MSAAKDNCRVLGKRVIEGRDPTQRVRPNFSGEKKSHLSLFLKDEWELARQRIQ